MSQAQSKDVTFDRELDILAQVQRNRAVTQRDIARVIGLSLGMTNAVLKRLASKGFISMRRINARNIRYLVTPAGVKLIAHRSYRYLRRTLSPIVRYKDRLLDILAHAAERSPGGLGRTEVVLVGESELDFLVEWCARNVGLAFRRQADAPGAGRPAGPHRKTEFVVASNQLQAEIGWGGEPGAAGPTRWWDLHLAELVIPVSKPAPMPDDAGRGAARDSARSSRGRAAGPSGRGAERLVQAGQRPGRWSRG
jgi:DNA-binding MarR family transcriptional regulator